MPLFAFAIAPKTSRAPKNPPKQLTFQHGTAQVRLTDALNGLDGNVVHDIIA